MLMSVQKENNVAGNAVSETHSGDSVYASLFEKINLNPVSALSALDIWSLIIRSAVSWMPCFIIRNFRKWSPCGGA